MSLPRPFRVPRPPHSQRLFCKHVSPCTESAGHASHRNQRCYPRQPIGVRLNAPPHTPGQLPAVLRPLFGSAHPTSPPPPPSHTHLSVAHMRLCHPGRHSAACMRQRERKFLPVPEERGGGGDVLKRNTSTGRPEAAVLGRGGHRRSEAPRAGGLQSPNPVD